VTLPRSGGADGLAGRGNFRPGGNVLGDAAAVLAAVVPLAALALEVFDVAAATVVAAQVVEVGHGNTCEVQTDRGPLRCAALPRSKRARRTSAPGSAPGDWKRDEVQLALAGTSARPARRGNQASGGGRQRGSAVQAVWQPGEVMGGARRERGSGT